MATHVVSGYEVGQRVQIVGAQKIPQLGTVRYVGAVDGYAGLWIGVEWDSGRGLHNGTLKGKTYFQTQGDQSGSFVRSHSFVPGGTLLEALVRRYGGPSGAPKLAEEDDMYVLSVRSRRMTVELVGKDQIENRLKQLEQLRTASLRYAGVSSSGPPGQISSVAPNIKELDLTGNLLQDWLAVENICKELSFMETLNLSCSRLIIPPNGPVLTLGNVKTLVLNSCNVKWKDVELLKGCLHLVEELHLCANGIQTIEVTGQESLSSPGTFVQGFESLCFLDLEDNLIESWAEIIKLSAFPRLQHLNLNSNKIRSVFYPETSIVSSTAEPNNQTVFKSKDLNSRDYFRSLRCLLLGNNQIADWGSIDALDKFPNLRDLRLSENPMTSDVTGGALRYLFISRIRNLTRLNGSEVKPRERRDSEIRYVRHVLNSAGSGSNEELRKLHPRFLELRLAHDVPVESVQVGAFVRRQKMVQTLLTLQISCVSTSVGERAPVTRKFPASTTIAKLKMICEALFKLKAAKQRLFLKDQDRPLPVPLEDDLQTLGDVGVGPGATILVDESLGH